MHQNLDELTAEIKYVIRAGDAPDALCWLRNVCNPDPKFPSGIVSSIYYDTMDWDFASEKLNSDYLKTKVRLRWYSETENRSGAAAAYAEVKYRIGCRRSKLRFEIPLSSDWLADAPLEDAEFSKLPGILKSHGVAFEKAIFPMLVVQYRRNRFIEPLTGARVCLDYDISSPRVNRRFLPWCNPLKLDAAVFELKSRDREMPARLHGLVDLGCRKASFSKYFACYMKHSDITV